MATALTINNWFMLKSGPKQDNIVLLDNHSFLCKLSGANREPFWEADDLLPHCSFYSTLHRNTQSGGQRTENLQLQSQTVTMWDMKPGL